LTIPPFGEVDDIMMLRTLSISLAAPAVDGGGGALAEVAARPASAWLRLATPRLPFVVRVLARLAAP